MTRVPQLDRRPSLVAIEAVPRCGHVLKGEETSPPMVTDALTGRKVDRAAKYKVAKRITEFMHGIVPQPTQDPDTRAPMRIPRTSP